MVVIWTMIVCSEQSGAQKGETKTSWNDMHKRSHEHQMCVLVVDMTNPARGKAILRR